MREILFRGKRTDTGKWVEGYYYKAKYYRTDTELCDYITMPHPKETQLGSCHIMVIPETVGQYTGLTDMNGKRIFEGDIVVCRQEINGNFVGYHIEIGYVEMKHGAFGLHRKQGYYRPFKDWLEDYEYAVIGNIHDNPELMKGGE